MLPSLSDVQTMETELPYRTELAEPDLRHRLDLRLQSFTWDLPQDLLILFEVGDSEYVALPQSAFAANIET